MDDALRRTAPFSLQARLLAETCTWTNITTRPEVNTVVAAGEYIWVGTRYSGLVRVHGKTGDTEFFTCTNSELPDNKIRSIVPHSNDDVWLIAGDILGRFRNNTWTAVEYPVFRNARYTPTVLSVTRENELWVGGVVIEEVTPGKGSLAISSVNRHPVLLRYKENEWTVFDSANSPVNSEVCGVAASTTGKLWVGVGRSLCIFNGAKWIVHDSLQQHTQFDRVVGVTINTAGVKWVCTRGHMVRMNGAKMKVWGRAAIGIPEGEIPVDVSTGLGGKVIVAYRGGFSCSKDTSWNTYNNMVTGDEAVTSVVFDSDENVWVGGSFGVRKFNGKRYTAFRTTMSPVSKRVTCLAIDADGDKWLGTDGGGLVRFDGKKWEFFNSGFQDRKIECVAIDSNQNKWVGTETGLHKFDGNRWFSFEYDEKCGQSMIPPVPVYHFKGQRQLQLHRMALYGPDFVNLLHRR